MRNQKHRLYLLLSQDILNPSSGISCSDIFPQNCWKRKNWTTHYVLPLLSRTSQLPWPFSEETIRSLYVQRNFSWRVILFHVTFSIIHPNKVFSFFSAIAKYEANAKNNFFQGLHSWTKFCFLDELRRIDPAMHSYTPEQYDKMYVEDSRYYTRNRGLFRTCYSGNSTWFFKEVLKKSIYNYRCTFVRHFCLDR